MLNELRSELYSYWNLSIECWMLIVEYWILNIEIYFEYWFWMFNLNIWHCWMWIFCPIQASVGVKNNPGWSFCNYCNGLGLFFSSGLVIGIHFLVLFYIFFKSQNLPWVSVLTILISGLLGLSWQNYLNLVVTTGSWSN